MQLTEQTREFLSHIGRKGGQATSKRKATASRRNGRLNKPKATPKNK